MELRDALRMLRSEAGLTQNEFASAVYVSFSTVNRWENQRMRPNRIQSKEILEFAKKRHASAACLELLSEFLLAPRVDDKDDRERIKQADERMKLEQRSLLTAEQFRKTMDNIDMALIGQRYYNRDPASCDVFYHNSYFARSFGYPPKEFEKKLQSEPFFAIAPEDRDRIMDRFEDLLWHRIDVRDFLVTVKAIRRDGSAFWMEIKAASLTEYSYGQEVFTSCRDVTRRMEAERRYKEEVLLRDASMQVMFSNIHCDLTENRVSRRHNLSAVIGREYAGETMDQLAGVIADGAPEGEERERFSALFNRAALMKAFGQGRVYGNAVLYNRHLRRWFRNEYLTVKNPVNGHIHALIYIFDIQKQVLSETMLGIFFHRFFDFVGLIDVEAETVEPYYFADGVFEARNPEKRPYRSDCQEKLARYGYALTSQQEGRAVALSTVLDRLREADFYSTVIHLRGYGGELLSKKVTYTYLDGNRDMIILAQSDMDALKGFAQRQKEHSREHEKAARALEDRQGEPEGEHGQTKAD